MAILLKNSILYKRTDLLLDITGKASASFVVTCEIDAFLSLSKVI